MPLVAFNTLGQLYTGEENAHEIFAASLTAVSIFVSVFALFITSQDYLSRRKLDLFTKGQLGYYFSIDKYVTQTGIYAIIATIFGLIVTSSFENNARLYSLDAENIFIIILLNVTFLAVYIILRSLLEFYIIRPSKFIMADLKDESLRDYHDNKGNK